MTVDELLERIDSRELSEWQAYERHAGPLGSVWQSDTLASIHELLQQLNYFFSQANFTDKTHRKGPAPRPEHWPRPSEVFEKVKARIGNEDDGG